MGKVVFLGVEGSGKTTLAMALTKAFARHAAEGWYLRPEGRGAYNFATIAPSDFATDGFPAQTSAAREMTWKVTRDGVERGDIQILDYPGEIYRLAFLTAEDEPDPDAFRARAEANAEELGVLNRAIEEAESLYVLFNLQDALDLRGDDANRSAVWVTNECLKRLKALPAKPRVTLVFTQVDRYQTDDDFLHSFTPSELDLIGHDHPDVDWMMVSVLVPPDSEFGIDAFVRRVTGLGEFGVPDGRPRSRAATGGALARLAAERRGEQERSGGTPLPPGVPVGVRSGETPLPPGGAVSVRSGETPLPPEGAVGVRSGGTPLPLGEDCAGARPHSRYGFLWLVLIFVGVFGVAYLAVTFLSERRSLSWGKRRPAASEGMSVVSNEVDSCSTNTTRSGETPLPPGEPPQQVRSGGTPLPPGESPQAQSNETAVVSVQAALSNETAVALAAARACSNLQDAREILTYAAEALNSAEALYERARVDDFLCWGAYVRKQDVSAGNPPWTKWLRRIDLLGEKKAAVMLNPATDNSTYKRYREQALEGYRAAAARGISAAMDALVRHASYKDDRDVRRVSTEKTEAR